MGKFFKGKVAVKKKAVRLLARLLLKVFQRREGMKYSITVSRTKTKRAPPRL